MYAWIFHLSRFLTILRLMIPCFLFTYKLQYTLRFSRTMTISVAFISLSRMRRRIIGELEMDERRRFILYLFKLLPSAKAWLKDGMNESMIMGRSNSTLSYMRIEMWFEYHSSSWYQQYQTLNSKFYLHSTVHTLHSLRRYLTQHKSRSIVDHSSQPFKWPFKQLRDYWK